MTFEDFFFDGKLIGFKSIYKNSLYFFGTRIGSAKILQAAFPQFHFAFMKQTHGDKLVEATSNLFPTALPEADAHWTPCPKVALTVATADCLPVLLSFQNAVCAIHAGWRGVENEITVKAIQALREKFGPPICICIGPHIQQQSFEVDLELAEKFDRQFSSYRQATFPLLHETSYVLSTQHSHKAYTSLKHILVAQIRSLGIHDDRIFELAVDTVSNSTFASFRRDKGQGPKAERNLSFVARLS